MRPSASTRLALLLLLAVSAGCSSGVNRPVQEVTAKTDADGVQRVRIVAHSFWFEPNRVVVKQGVPVELSLHNNSAIVPHNFSCIAPDAGLETKQGLGLVSKSKTVKFTPKEPGEYPFFCAVDGHSKKGMQGTIVVVP